MIDVVIMSKFKIDKNISRLSLHDSRIEDDVRDAQNITIMLDWAKLDNMTEFGIEDGVILGKTIFKIYGVSNEKLIAFNDNEGEQEFEIPERLGTLWSEVGTTEIDDYSKTLKIGGVCRRDEKVYWTEWFLTYEACEVEWNTYVTVTDWRNGKLPHD